MNGSRNIVLAVILAKVQEYVRCKAVDFSTKPESAYCWPFLVFEQLNKSAAPIIPPELNVRTSI
jgi:hypothetical protein